MKRFHTSTLFATLLAACSSTNQPVKVVVLAPKPAPPPPVATRSVQRTPGSLWSDDSRWNEMYSHPTARIVGDYVTFRINESFRTRILAQMPPEPEVKKKRSKGESTEPTGDAEKDREHKKRDFEEAKAKNKDLDRNDPSVKADRAKEKETEERMDRLAAKQARDAQGQSPDSSLSVVASEKLSDSPTIEGSIRQVLPRGSYSIYASQVLVIGGKPCVVTFDGQVREQDIDQNVAHADAISNLRLDVETKESKVGKNAPREDGAEQ